MTENDSRNDAAFHRPPRAFPSPVPTEQISLAPPPATHGGQHEGLLSVLFPVVGSLGLFAFALVYHNRLFLYIACAMVAISIVFALAMRWSQRRRGKKTARRQRRRYREYLAGQEARLEQIAQLQLASALRRHPDPQGLWTSVARREHLWERRPGDADFLSVRAGRAPVAHVARPKVDLGHNPLAEYEQALLDEVRDVAEIWGTVDDVPVAVALRAAPVLAVVGPRERASACVRAMLMQLATWHAPSDLRLAVAHAGRAEDWDWTKWLPHARRDGTGAAAPAPRLALAADAASLSALLDEHVGPRLDQLRTLASVHTTRREAAEIDAPQLVLVVDGVHPADPRARLPLLREVLAHGRELRVALICTVEQPGDEPAETSARLRLNERGPATLEETGPAGYVQRDVRVDESPAGAVEAVARSLAPVRLQEHGVAGALDARDGLLGLLGLPSIDALDPRAEWSRRPRSLALRATIGVDRAGRRLELDLKQAAEGGMGPHGLIIGATGSGKSELLRTLVTSLALAHPPDELSFVFVDFKGGAAFAELEGLPHTAGMITNLQSDLRLVDRMHAALHGEQERRQRLLREAGNVDDVIAYRSLRERNPSLPALPDLLVVIDEFGELLASRPEYIDLFVAIGRVGRSLGIHLLFSSQRFDEGRLRGLESHLRYRICLRTFSPLESKGVLGTPDAYVLPPEPGLGYLKVDTSVYERFRAALVTEPRSARATPSSRAPVVVPFAAGAPAAALVPARSERGPGTDDLRRIVQRLRDAHAAGPVHQVWSPPLDALITLDAVAATPAFWERAVPPAQISATVGMVDLPREQRTQPLVLDLAGTAGHLAVVGAPQSGKSTLLRTLVLDLARTHTPEELQVLAIDLGGGLLRGLSDLPHVGAVAGKADRELVHRIIARARAEIEAREADFRRLGLDSMDDVHARRRAGQEVPCGHLVLVVDGWAALRRDFQELDFAIEELLGSGLTYGLHVVITANRWAEMRPSVSDNLGARLELRLNDPIESELGRHASAALPQGVPGRGLARGGLEFQAALPRLDGRPTAQELGPALAAAATAIAGRWNRPPAPPVLVLPRVLERAELAAGGDGAAGVALGVEEERLETVRVDLGGPDAHLLVLGDGESGRTNVLRAFVEGLGGGPQRPRVIVLDPRRTLGDVAALAHVETYATTATGAAQAVTGLVALAGERAAQVEVAAATVPGPPIYLVVDDYDLLAGPEGNPLAPLTSILARGRDLGLHVVLARRVAGVTRASFEPFFQQLLELRTPGLVLSGDPAEGPLLDGHRARPLPPGRGLLVRRGRRPVLVQTVLAPPLRPVAPADPPRPRLTLAGGMP